MRMIQLLGREPSVCAERMLHPVFLTDEELKAELGSKDDTGVLLMTQDATRAPKTDMHTPEAVADAWATTMAVLDRSRGTSPGK